MSGITVEVTDINKFFKDLLQCQLDGNFAFRGISRENQIYPTLIREFIRKFGRNSDSSDLLANISLYEEKLLRNFAKYGARFLPANTNFIDWIASAQHFGIPTRLIDWTYNPFNAIFFSVFLNKKPDHSCYQVFQVDLNAHSFTDTVVTRIPTKWGYNEYEYLFIDQYKNYLKKIENEHQENINSQSDNFYKLYFLGANQSNPRIIAQSGLFQLQIWTSNKEHVLETPHMLGGIDKIYRIEKGLRDEIINKLARIQVTTLTMFPDLENICKYIVDNTNMPD